MSRQFAGCATLTLSGRESDDSDRSVGSRSQTKIEKNDPRFDRNRKIARENWPSVKSSFRNQDFCPDFLVITFPSAKGLKLPRFVSTNEI